MKSPTSTLGLSILVGGLAFVGSANAIDLIVNGSFEVEGRVIGASILTGWTGFMGTYNHSDEAYYAGPPIPAAEMPGDVYSWRHGDATGGVPSHPPQVTQTVSLTNAVTSADIDAGRGQFTFSAWLASYSLGPEHPYLILEFFDAVTNQVGSTVIFDRASANFWVGNADPNDFTSPTNSNHMFSKYEHADLIPSGARNAKVAIVQSPNFDPNVEHPIPPDIYPDTYVDLVKLDVTTSGVLVPPSVATVVPSNGATNVRPDVVLSVTLNDGTTAVNTDSIQFSFDGTPVIPSIAKTDSVTTIQYDPPGILPPLSAHSFRIVFSDNGVPVTTQTNIFSFTISSDEVPSATTGIPTAITTNSATLNGTVNPNGWPTSVYFEWGTTTNYGSASVPQTIGAGVAPVAVQAHLLSLVTDTVYHHRVVASNRFGVVFGDDVLVTPTLLLYLYAGESWSYMYHDLPEVGILLRARGSAEIYAFSILSHSFSPGGSVLFEAFLTSTNEAPVVSKLVNSPAAVGMISKGAVFSTGGDRLGAVRLTMLTGSVVVTSIESKVIVNGFGSFDRRYSNTIVATKLPQPPYVGTQFLSNVTASSVDVYLDVNPNNLDTGLFVEWGASTNYGAVVPAVGNGAVQLGRDYFIRWPIPVSNLAPNTPYHFRAFASNAAGITYGYDLPLASGVALPRFTSIIRQQDSRGSRVWMQATGTAGLNYTLQSSTAISNWVAITNLTFAPNGTINTTQDASGGERSFFRFRWP